MGRLRQLYPMRDICYLHGIIERQDGDNATERYVSFFAEDTSPEAERDAFAAAWSYMRDRPSVVLYFYSKYERTQCRNLRNRNSDVCSEADIEALFDPHRAVDLYNDGVMKATEWPACDYSIKTPARYLGFAWRDLNASGAASIEWYGRWAETGDPVINSAFLITTRMIAGRRGCCWMGFGP